MAVRKLACCKGQMAVELCAVIPVVMVIAAIVFNALTFFSYCAQLDREFRNATRVWVVAPPSSMDLHSAVEQLDYQVWFDPEGENPAISFAYEVDGGGLVTVTATMEYRPTLFGLQTRQELFGVRLPALSHTAQMTVACDDA